MQSVEGRVAVVTGAASGMGLGMVRAFAGAGMRVVAADVRAEPLAEAVGLLRADGHDVVGVPTDVSKLPEVEAPQRSSADGGEDDVRRDRARAALVDAQAHDDEGHSTFTTTTLARPRLRTLKALALTGDFEGRVTFAFALTHRAKYRVFELSSPRRLVIDVRHAS